MGFLINISPSLSFFLSFSVVEKARDSPNISWFILHYGDFQRAWKFYDYVLNNHQTRYFESRTRSIYSKTNTRGRHLVLRKHAPSDPADKIGGRKTNSAIPRPLDPSIIDSK